MNVCGVEVTDGWQATLVIGGALVALLGLGAWSADWAQRRYERVKNHPRIVRRSRLPAEPLEEFEDD